MRMGRPQPMDAPRGQWGPRKMSGRWSQGLVWVPFQGSSFVLGTQGLRGSHGDGGGPRPVMRMGNPAPFAMRESNLSACGTSRCSPGLGAAVRADASDTGEAGREPVLAADFGGDSMRMTPPGAGPT